MNTTHNAEAMRKRREQLGLSCRELGECIGVEASTICRYESGGMRIRYDRIIPLANALDMEVDELMGWPTLKPLAHDDYERLIAALKRLHIIRPDGSVDFERFAEIEAKI